MDNRTNNFDFLRLIFASFVIVTHSYPLSGSPKSDFLFHLSNGQISLSYIGVRGFFIISGYLIFQSLERSHNVLEYFRKRILRIFPALFVVLLLTVILAPFVYESGIPFFQNTSVLTYIPNNLLLYKNQYEILGIFEKNPYKSAINGSLWTLPYEFTLYILLSFLIIFRSKEKVVKGLLLISFLLLLIVEICFFNQLKQYRHLSHFLELSIYFNAGALIAATNFEKINRKNTLLILFSILVIISIYFNFFIHFKYIALPIIIIFWGLSPISFICNIKDKIGDLSYGIYIYGFPVQQTLMYYFKLNYMDLMIYSLVITYIFAYFSWHLIEKQALKLKKTKFALSIE
jgi:peptidoglycan/LPS O-acetylase OafA/YrhL